MKRVQIIAEVGVNHNGCIDNAYRLIDAAQEAGADWVKFQTYNLGAFVTRAAPMAQYQRNQLSAELDGQMEMLRSLQLSPTDHTKLMRRCTDRGLNFLSTAFDIQSLDFLVSLGVRLLKIPSGAITDLPFLRRAASYNLPTILSTGMSTLAEVDSAVRALTESNLDRTNITLLHCTSDYPCRFDEVNLMAINRLAGAFNLPVGYSDHSLGIDIALAASALGAVVIEKHLTLDRKMSGPDHSASITPKSFSEMVRGIRTIEIALGDGYKRPMPYESSNISPARKSIVASRKINKGEIFTEENITAKRPGNGLSPMRWDEVLGLVANRDFDADDFIAL